VKRGFRFGCILLLLAGGLSSTGCRGPQAKNPPAVLDRSQLELFQGGITRGDKTRKAIAFAFTGHGFAEGGETILNELDRHHAKLHHPRRASHHASDTVFLSPSKIPEKLAPSPRRRKSPRAT
jgi:hypothetical protein